MAEKNPYENDSVDIPDFSSTKDDDEDIDRSIFSLNNDEEEDEDEDDEEYYDEAPKYYKVKRSALIICIVVFCLLLVGAVFGIIWGVSNNNKYNSLKTEYDTYVSKAKETENSLNAKITELEAQINSSSSSSSETDGTSSETTTYKVSDAVGSINVRSGANSNNSRVKYSDLPSDVQSSVKENDDGYAYVEANSTFKVLETSKDTDSSENKVWAKIADNAWICIESDGAKWASKQ